jgi:hypothetical protein
MAGAAAETNLHGNCLLQSVVVCWCKMLACLLLHGSACCCMCCSKAW